MQVMRRTIVALGAATAILALVGCGGLGVNIGSGPSRGSGVVNLVGITVQSGPNIYSVSRNLTILLVATAYYQYGSQNYVSSTQGATWSIVNGNNFIGNQVCGSAAYGCTTSGTFTGAVGLFNGDCFTPYTGQPLQNICVLGYNVGAAGATTASISATVEGHTGTITMNIQ